MRRSLFAGAVSLALLIAVVPSVSATTTWTARMGSYGVATIRIGSPDRLSLNVKHFRAHVSYPVSLRRGSCARLGTLVWSTRLTSSSTGTLVRTVSLTRAQTVAAKLPLAIRVGTKCAVFTAPAPAPTPTATLQPSPSPSETPPGGDTLFVGDGFLLTIPEGWNAAPPSSGYMVFRGPGSQSMGMLSIPSNLTLDAVSTLIIDSIRSQSGADPEQTEAITMDGIPARLLTYHFVAGATTVHELDAFTVNNGRAFEIIFANVAGTEGADRALLLSVLASFKFMGGAF
jgi:hypothetical protein